MATQKTVYATLILAAIMLTALAEARECMDECMPVCMEVEGANHEKCVEACEGYCDQTEGASKDKCHQWAC